MYIYHYSLDADSTNADGSLFEMPWHDSDNAAQTGLMFIVMSLQESWLSPFCMLPIGM